MQPGGISDPAGEAPEQAYHRQRSNEDVEVCCQELHNGRQHPINQSLAARQQAFLGYDERQAEVASEWEECILNDTE
jgi:hypothetical protein